MKGRFGKTFGIKLYSMFIISVCVPFLIAAVSFMVYYNSTYMAREEKNQRNLLQSVSQNIESQFQELVNIGNTYYMQKEVFKMAECWNNPALYQYSDDLSKTQLLRNYIITMVKQMHMSRLQVRGIAFFPLNEQIPEGYLLTMSSDNLRHVPREEFQQEEWYEMALSADGEPVFYPGHEPGYYKKPEEVYSLVRCIRNMDTKRVIGVQKIDVKLDTLKKTLDVVSEQSGGLLLTFGDRMVYCSETLAETTFKIQSSDHVQMGRKLYVKNSVPVSGSDWELSYLFTRGALISSVFYTGLIVAVAIVISMAAGLMVYRKQSDSLVGDVNNITAALKEIETGNLDTRISVSMENELQDIAEAINHMTDSLKAYIEREYLLVINQQKAEYSALQAQINPHFFYNTLNGFVALNRMGERDILEESIISLTRLFRYTCQRRDITTVREEFAFLEEYLKLEKLKYEERLEYLIWTEDGCENVEIPKLLLQPLVENSIVHGMGDTMDTLTIRIFAGKMKVRGIGEMTVISIRDNGVGFEIKKLEEMNERVGVVNVRDRAELYWKDVVYQVQSRPGQGCTTTIAFPVGKESRI